MSNTPADKLVENEVIFQRLNEALKANVESVLHNRASDEPLDFFCECSDEDCLERIRLEPSEFSQIHRSKRHFFVIPGHETGEIERIVERHEGYDIVSKRLEPPTYTDMKLNPTDL